MGTRVNAYVRTYFSRRIGIKRKLFPITLSDKIRRSFYNDFRRTKTINAFARLIKSGINDLSSAFEL